MQKTHDYVDICPNALTNKLTHNNSTLTSLFLSGTLFKGSWVTRSHRDDDLLLTPGGEMKNKGLRVWCLSPTPLVRDGPSKNFEHSPLLRDRKKVYLLFFFFVFTLFSFCSPTLCFFEISVSKFIFRLNKWENEILVRGLLGTYVLLVKTLETIIRVCWTRV